MMKETTGGGGLAEGLSEIHNKYSRKKEKTSRRNWSGNEMRYNSVQ